MCMCMYMYMCMYVCMYVCMYAYIYIYIYIYIVEGLSLPHAPPPYPLALHSLLMFANLYVTASKGMTPAFLVMPRFFRGGHLSDTNYLSNIGVLQKWRIISQMKVILDTTKNI